MWVAEGGLVGAWGNVLGSLWDLGLLGRVLLHSVAFLWLSLGVRGCHGLWHIVGGPAAGLGGLGCVGAREVGAWSVLFLIFVGAGVCFCVRWDP